MTYINIEEWNIVDIEIDPINLENLFLIGDSREDPSRNPTVNGIRTELQLLDSQTWAKSSLKVTHIGNGYNPSINSFYGLNNLVISCNAFSTIIYRLGVNDIASINKEYMWIISMINAHINILCSDSYRLTYNHFGSSTVFPQTQTRGFIQPSSSSYVEIPIIADEWYCILVGYRTSDLPNYNLRISDGTRTEYFKSDSIGIKSSAPVHRIPIYWKSKNSGILKIDYVNSTTSTGVWYLGEIYNLKPKLNSKFILVGETNWDNSISGKSYNDILGNIHENVSRTSIMPWIEFNRSNSIIWNSQTNSTGTDNGHYTNSTLLSESVKKFLS